MVNLARRCDMAFSIDDPRVRLFVDEDGVVRVRGTRVPLDTIVAVYKQGVPPEEIADRFSTVTLADVYSTLAFYFDRREDVEAYLHERERMAETVQRENEAKWPRDGVRERLLARRDEQRG
jgi:uncharacterized protein (DUF433 family)